MMALLNAAKKREDTTKVEPSTSSQTNYPKKDTYVPGISFIARANGGETGEQCPKSLPSQVPSDHRPFALSAGNHGKEETGPTQLAALRSPAKSLTNF